MQRLTIFNGMAARPHVLLLSGGTHEELERLTSEIAAELERRPDDGLDELGARLSRLDHPRAHRRIVVAADAEAAAQALRGGDPQAVRTAPRPADGGGIAFAFPGGGAQHPGMVGRLYALSPVVCTEVDRCAELLDVDVRRALDPATSPGELEQPVLGLCALFVAERRRYEERFRALFREGRERGELRTDLDDATAALVALSAANWAYTWLRPGAETDGLADRFTALLLDGMRGYASP